MGVLPHQQNASIVGSLT